MANRWGNNGNSKRLFSWAPKSLQMVTAVMKENYDKPRNMFKNRDITLLTKVHIVKAMVSPVVMYRYESWTMKKFEPQELMLSNCDVG